MSRTQTRSKVLKELCYHKHFDGVASDVIKAVAVNDFYQSNSNYIGVIPEEFFGKYSATLLLNRSGISKGLCCSLVSEAHWSFGHGQLNN